MSQTFKQINIQNRKPGGWDDYFHVRGGPFASEQIMGWHITDEKGFTLGVSPSHEFAKFCQESLELKKLLKKTFVKAHLEDLRDEGYLDDVSEKDWEKLKELLS